jgi:LmbE family N-acetylglucosaminyl deacetylase
VTRIPSAAATLVAALVLHPIAPLPAQVAPPSTGGAAALARQLAGLGTVKRVLVVGAHPDDEDTSLLALLALGGGADAAYLSLSRGEGGQNLIGPELGEELGIIRTGELLSARSTDGARQFFSRAYDFGYSKALAEALEQWPRDSLLKDAVRIIRRFRPQVVVSIFRGTSRDGHGQHQAAGWVAHEAFAVAGDPARFPELQSEEGLPAWTPSRLYVSTRFDTAGTTAELDAGVLDPILGQSYHQVAMRSRSLHRSQDMGQLERMGPAPVRLRLVTDRAGRGGGLFDGADTLLTSALGAERARRFARTAAELRRLGPGNTAAARPLLESAWELLSGGRGVEVIDQRARLAEAERIFRGLLVDAIAEQAEVLAGGTVDLTLSVWNSGPDPAQIRLELISGRGWVPPQPEAGCTPLESGAVRTVQVAVPIPPELPISDPYYLVSPRRGSLYDWGGTPPPWRGLPFEPAPLSVRLVLCGGTTPRVLAERPVTRRINDQALGELRRPLLVVPRVAVALEPSVALWPTGGEVARAFTVTLRSAVPGPTRGTVALEAPAGWSSGDPRRFELAGMGATTALRFEVRAPRDAAQGASDLRAVVTTDDGSRWATGLRLVDYSHIEPRAHAVPAVARVAVAPMELPEGRKVGYVRGAADRIPEALAAVGLPVELLEESDLSSGDLGAYDAIVIGPRAYEVDSALVRNNARLVDYARRGGLVVVQYQQQTFFRGQYAPFPLDGGPAGAERSSARFASYPRVAEETAGIRLLAPDHPAFTRPNRIGPADWSGWVQERGLYFAPDWDPAWTPLLETADTGEEPRRGGLLVARVGEGRWVYTGLSFFRQLPAGVPGAYRLFLNLLALNDKAR